MRSTAGTGQPRPQAPSFEGSVFPGALWTTYVVAGFRRRAYRSGDVPRPLVVGGVCGFGPGRLGKLGADQRRRPDVPGLAALSRRVYPGVRGRRRPRMVAPHGRRPGGVSDRGGV